MFWCFNSCLNISNFVSRRELEIKTKQGGTKSQGVFWVMSTCSSILFGIYENWRALVHKGSEAFNFENGRKFNPSCCPSEHFVTAEKDPVQVDVHASLPPLPLTHNSGIVDQQAHLKDKSLRFYYVH